MCFSGNARRASGGKRRTGVNLTALSRQSITMRKVGKNPVLQDYSSKTRIREDQFVIWFDGSTFHSL